MNSFQIILVIHINAVFKNKGKEFLFSFISVFFRSNSKKSQTIQRSTNLSKTVETFLDFFKHQTLLDLED